jgi:hypothetical protein
VLVLAAPLSIDAGEITDKARSTSRAVLDHRAQLVTHALRRAGAAGGACVRLLHRRLKMNIDVRPLILKDHAVRLRGLRNG